MPQTTYSSWGSAQIFSASMERNNLRSMGTLHNTRRLQTRIHSEASVFRNYKHKSNKERRKYIFKRDPITLRKRCYRRSTIKHSSSRFLQYLISGNQKEWEIETCDQSKTAQSISVQETFQNGHFIKSSKSDKAERLGSIHRSQRCLPAHTDFSSSQKISEILFPRQILSMESHVFRTNSCTKSVYKSSVSSSSISKSNEYPTCSLLGRLAGVEPNESEATTGFACFNRSVDIFGIYNKSRKVKSGTETEFCVHRSMVQTQSSYSKPNGRETGEDTASYSTALERANKCKRFSSSVGSYGILYRADSKCTAVHASDSTASTQFLETCHTYFGQSCPTYTTSKITFEMVAKSSKHHEGSIVTPVCNRIGTHNRCFEDHVWGSFGGQLCTRVLDTGTNKTSYKCTGNESSSYVSSTFCTFNSGEISTYQNRQYNCSTVHKQTRGYQVQPALSRNMEFMANGFSVQYISEGITSSREDELSCRSAQPSQNQGNRMDIEQNSSSGNISKMGQANDGSLCITSQSPDSSFLFMVSNKSSICNRCSEHILGEHVCLCISTCVSHSQSAKPYTAVPLSDNSNTSSVAQEVLVFGSPRAGNSHTDQVTEDAQSVNTTRNTDCSSETGDIQSNSLAPVNRRLQKTGFSQKARRLLMAAWRKGTQKDYATKFKLYNSWCDARQINPYTATIVQIADFITHLYYKGLQYSTINGYRSMLSTVLPCIESYKVGQHPYVIQLLKGVFNLRPPVVKLVPEWDLLKVLDALQKKPFEPMSKASLKLITYKTVFMIAITCFRRCSDLQSFQIGQGSVNIQSKGITFLRHGLAKQDRQSHRKATVFIPSFPENKKLDPKRCLYYYLKTTERFRKSPEGSDKEETRVFLSINEPHRPVAAQTLSRWIVECLKIALKDKDLKTKGHSTRAMGPSLALFRGASVESIMNSADWSSDTTFVRFYLRDLSCNVLKEL